jgi:hypothetical protein
VTELAASQFSFDPPNRGESETGLRALEARVRDGGAPADSQSAFLHGPIHWVSDGLLSETLARRAEVTSSLSAITDQRSPDWR